MDNNILYIILVLICVMIYIKLMQESSEKFSSTQKNAICFITRYLEPELLNFANKCAVYNDVYIIVDDNKQEIKSTNPKVLIVQIDENICKDKKYINSTWRFKIEVSGWDKAFYYFCENNNVYDNVWFIEDDVFIGKPNTLSMIDKKYGKVDLLINKMNNISRNKSDNEDWNQRIKIAKNFYKNKEIYWSWVCAMRCSKELLNNIKKFRNENNQLFFHEIMIPTMISNSDLTYKKIQELSNIIYRKTYKDSEIVSNPMNLYHPIKDYNRHVLLHNLIK